MFCAGAAAGRSGAASKNAGIALRGFIGRALSRLSGAATLDTGILGSECADTQNAGSQRNEHCAKNSFPNSLFHGKVLSVVCYILSVALTVRSRHCQNHPNQSRLN